jgi:hypothetical protein
MSETDWEKRAHEIVAEEFQACRASDKPYWREPDFEIRAALRVGREMAEEAWREAEATSINLDAVCREAADARTQEIANAIERAAHRNQDCSCAAIARSYISKPAVPNAILNAPSTVFWPNDEACDLNGWARGSKIVSDASGFTITPPQPKTRERVLEEALRAIECCTPPGFPGVDRRDWAITRDGGERAAATARRALEWKP